MNQGTQPNGPMENPSTMQDGTVPVQKSTGSGVTNSSNKSGSSSNGSTTNGTTGSDNSIANTDTNAE